MIAALLVFAVVASGIFAWSPVHERRACRRNVAALRSHLPAAHPAPSQGGRPTDAHSATGSPGVETAGSNRALGLGDGAPPAGRASPVLAMEVAR